jgi:hypothetical protein
MQASMAELVHAWHDFYVLVGTASATLVGLMFVTASIGAPIFTEKNREALRAFISPTVVHFSTALFLCILALIPAHGSLAMALLLAVAGVAGLVYSSRLLVQLFVQGQFHVDIVDRLFYAGIPVVGYVLVLIAASLLLIESEHGLELFAAALITLLLAGIRNAWDMTIWIVVRTPTSDAGQPPTT